MTKLLETALSEASKLPDEDQDAIAKWLLEELASERRWSRAFAGSQDTLERLATEALEEYRSGHTVPLDPDAL